MKLKVSGIDHVNMEVINLEESVKFYNNLFGFELLKEQPDDISKIIGNEKVKLCLYETPGFQGYEVKGFHHFGFHIENFKEVVQKCTDMGVEIFYGGPIKWEKSSSIYIKDPNGYDIKLAEVSGGGL